MVKIPINQWRYWNLERLVTNITLQPENLPSEVTELKGKAGIFTALQAEGFGPHWIARIANYVLKPGGHAVIDYPSDLEWKSKSHFPQSYFGSLRPLQNNHIWWIKE